MMIACITVEGVDYWRTDLELLWNMHFEKDFVHASNKKIIFLWNYDLKVMYNVISIDSIKSLYLRKGTGMKLISEDGTSRRKKSFRKILILFFPLLSFWHHFNFEIFWKQHWCINKKKGVRNVICLSENLACCVFLKHPFWDSPFLPYYRRITRLYFSASTKFRSGKSARKLSGEIWGEHEHSSGTRNGEV